VHDITADLRGALAPMVTTNHAAITDRARAGNGSAPSLASRLDRIAARPRGAWVVENSCIGIGATAAAAIPSSCNTSSLSISEFPIPAGLWWAARLRSKHWFDCEPKMFDNMVHEDFRIIQLDRSGDGRHRRAVAS
jgi:hypothetical protein